MPKSKFLAAALAATAFMGVSAPASATDNWIDELRVGVYDHASDAFGSSHETNNPDINAEALFASPDWLSWAGAPRPMIGANLNTGGGTSIAYAGLAWDYYFTDAIFVEGTFGGAIHNGETSGNNGPDRDRMNYGCRAMFHESASLGYNFDGHSSLMLTIDHMSNASLCDENPGLTDIGVRYGFKF
ncbi:acyloxyacyl hydrolase [Parvibaculum sp.]|uniref:acyloxyacyl hydrolase n=1 Tax=Parvibaculum sp. TaxID=2024848 RepID=UPI002CAD9FE9|nr:acyloxyacyl hydrolase [Parvibaculum sp.]HUD51596.1 acyloxyacyl hydrolase [Parvibaculum sp.]